MPVQRFLIKYPDGSKKHVNAREREQMLLAGEIRKAGEDYAYCGQVKTYHSFSDLAELRTRIESRPNELRRFLSGQFVIEYPRRLGGKRVHELLETPEALALRLSSAQAAV